MGNLKYSSAHLIRFWSLAYTFRIMPSCAVDATSVPFLVNTLALAKPLEEPAQGLCDSHKSQSSALKFAEWNQTAWSTLAANRPLSKMVALWGQRAVASKPRSDATASAQ